MMLSITYKLKTLQVKFQKKKKKKTTTHQSRNHKKTTNIDALN